MPRSSSKFQLVLVLGTPRQVDPINLNSSIIAAILVCEDAKPQHPNIVIAAIMPNTLLLIDFYSCY